MRVNPKYQNTCHNRLGMYREGQCTDGPHPCTFLSDCDQHYDPVTGTWDYPNPLAPRGSDPIIKGAMTERALSQKEKGVLTAIRNGSRESTGQKFTRSLDRDAIIRQAVIQHTDKCGAVYSDVLVEATGFDKRIITDYLKRNGFEKPAGHTSRRWVKDWVSNPLDDFIPSI